MPTSPSCIWTSKSVFVCFFLPPSDCCWLFFKDFFCTTCEMPSRSCVRINNGIHTTKRTARLTKPGVCGLFHISSLSLSLSLSLYIYIYIYIYIYLYIYIYIYIYRPIGIVFANGPRDWGSIPGRVIPKTQKMVVDASLLNTRHYKVRIKAKWSHPEKRVAPSLHHGVVANAKGTFVSPSNMVG